jgi:hypothetical protein
VPAPGDPPGGPDRDPAAGLTGEERARAVRRLVRRLQAGGIAFLAVVCLGFLPAVLATEWPALGRVATFGVWVVAPAIPIGLLVFAAFRLPR